MFCLPTSLCLTLLLSALSALHVKSHTLPCGAGAGTGAGTGAAEADEVAAAVAGAAGAAFTAAFAVTFTAAAADAAADADADAAAFSARSATFPALTVSASAASLLTCSYQIIIIWASQIYV